MARLSTETFTGDGKAATPFRLEPPPRRRIGGSRVLAAVLVVGVTGLAAVVVFSQAAARTPVVALANPVARGQEVAADDLRVVRVASDDPVAWLPEERLGELVGRLAVADLEAGTILTEAHFRPRATLEQGEGVVGLSLAPGEYPSPRLAPGDTVAVVSVAGVAAEGGNRGEVALLVSGAEVVDVAELGPSGERFVSLLMPEADAARVARESAAGAVRLVQVAGKENR
jgi:hypothetical protein